MEIFFCFHTNKQQIPLPPALPPVLNVNMERKQAAKSGCDP